MRRNECLFLCSWGMNRSAKRTNRPKIAYALFAPCTCSEIFCIYCDNTHSDSAMSDVIYYKLYIMIFYSGQEEVIRYVTYNCFLQ